MRLCEVGHFRPAGHCWLVTSHSPIQKSNWRNSAPAQGLDAVGGGDGVCSSVSASRNENGMPPMYRAAGGDAVVILLGTLTAVYRTFA